MFIIFDAFEDHLHTKIHKFKFSVDQFLQFYSKINDIIFVYLTTLLTYNLLVNFHNFPKTIDEA